MPPTSRLDWDECFWTMFCNRLQECYKTTWQAEKGRLGMRPWELCFNFKLRIATCPMIWTRTPKAPAWTGMWAVYPDWTRSACPSRSKRILVSGYCARRVGLGPEPEHRANTTTPGNGRTATASSERRPFQAPRVCDLPSRADCQRKLAPGL